MLRALRNIISGLVHSQKLGYETIRRADELIWSAVFKSAITDSSWFKNQSIYPGRWAAGYPFLYILFRVYNDIKPKSILEFGLGETTKLAYQYQEAFPESQLIIIEHDPDWLFSFSNTVHNILSKTIILGIEYKKVRGFDTKVYKGLIQEIKERKFDLIIVDGPWGSEHFSRYQIIDVIEKDLLALDFIIIVDDYERDGEKETVVKIREMLKEKKIGFVEGVYRGAKDTILICSEKYKFLASL